MDELNDYSGAFNPQVKFEDFSKDTLVELLKLYSKLFVAVDGFWYLSVMQKVNEEMATDCDLWVWEKQGKYEIQRINQLLNIQGNHIPAFFKYLQLSPFYQNLGYEMDVLTDDLGVVTITHCQTLESLEKEGKHREDRFCDFVERRIFTSLAQRANADIKVTALKLPPRKSEDDVCCQWEFRILDSGN